MLALALAAMPMGAHAAGLGKLAVYSALGQPLRAEIDLTASREEFTTLTARLAPSDAFKNAGIEYSSALLGLRFSLDKRANGQPYLIVSSERPFNEPFVDMLVEVNWAAGRLVREYTFLLDPPDVFNKPSVPAPVAVPEVRKEAAPVATVPVQETGAAAATEPKIPESRTPVSGVKAAEDVKTARKIAEKPAEGAETRLVKKGDTLAKIALEVKPEGINLDQMLVALLRANPDVFDAGNMNRLRAGKILNIPAKDAIPAVEAGEARKIVVAQSADFNVYRRKLAALASAQAAKEEAPKQLAAGKITPRVEEKAAPVPAGKDKLEVSRTESGKDGKTAARLAAAEEDLVARDRALKEANSRIAALEKNLADLKKLAEMKSAAGAKLQESATPAKAVAAPPAAEKPAEKPAEPPKAAEPAPKPAESVPPAPKPVVKKPAMPPPPPPPPPSFVEENPGLVFGGGGVLALLLGYLGYSAWRKKRVAAEAAPDSVANAEFSSNSVFGSTGGQSVDTGASLPTDFSQEGTAGVAGDEGVDPVAEADVYMAYGRDSQAEEILLEALKTDPTRRAIHLKLLEIYAARKSVQQFAAVARELHGLTAGAGADWEKAAALGRSIDPANPLYGASPAAGADMTATVITSAATLMAGRNPMDGANSETVVLQAAPTEVPAEEPVEEIPSSLDFDLDLGTDTEMQPEEAAAQVEAPVEAPPAADEVLSLDFDLDLGSPPAAQDGASAAAEPESIGLDFDLDTPAVEPQVESAPIEPTADLPASGSGGEMSALDFDFDLGDMGTEPSAAPVAAVEHELPALDLSSISLDLDDASASPAPAELAELSALLPEPAVIEDDPEVATKIELAQAYEEMGDKEGARELLNEVLSEGSPAQQETARVKLAQLG